MSPTNPNIDNVEMIAFLREYVATLPDESERKRLEGGALTQSDWKLFFSWLRAKMTPSPSEE